jgi:hypothetical protein
VSEGTELAEPDDEQADEGLAGELDLFVATGPYPGPGDSDGGGVDYPR